MITDDVADRPVKARRRAPRHDAFAVCAPGLEQVVAAELHGLGLRTGTAVRSGVPFKASSRELYTACLWLATAERVQVRVASFEAQRFPQLLDGAADVDWAAYLAPGTPRLVRANSKASKLYHSVAVAERVAMVVDDTVPPGKTPKPDEEQPQILVRVVRDQVTISVDASGPLHRRGWRLAVAKAPLRETVAAAVVRACGWTPDLPIIDPFCGAGTLPVEAALLARHMAPGRHRTPLVAQWPSFEPGTWASAVGAADAGVLPAPPALIHGADRDGGAITSATANAERAGVSDSISLANAAVSNLKRPAGPAGWLVTNPPWGDRVSGSSDLRNLYARVGDLVRTSFEGWSLAMIVPVSPTSDKLVGQTGLTFTEALTTSSGGNTLRLLVFTPAVGAEPTRHRA